MINKGYKFLLFVLLIYTPFFGPADGMAGRTDERIVAIVNDEVITAGDVENSGGFQKISISSLIEKRLQLQIARKKGVSVNDSELSSAMEDFNLKGGDSSEDYKKELTEHLTILKFINREIKSKITISDKELEDYYSVNKDHFSLPEEIRVGYLYLPVKTSDSVESIQWAQKKIKDIQSELKDNVSFNEIKRRYPEVQISEDLGYIRKGHLLQELDRVAFVLKEGEVSDEIYTSSGFYIIKVLEKKGIAYSPLQDVRDMVMDSLFKEKSERIYKDWLYEIKSSSYIEIKI